MLMLLRSKEQSKEQQNRLLLWETISSFIGEQVICTKYMY